MVFMIISYAAVVFDWYQLIDFLPVTSFLTSLFSDFSRCWHSTAVLLEAVVLYSLRSVVEMNRLFFQCIEVNRIIACKGSLYELLK